MYYSKAMTETVKAWAEHRKKTMTVYKTDGQLFWFKGVLMGFTLKDGTKVALDGFMSSGVGTVGYKARKTVKAYSQLLLSFNGYGDGSAEKWHALWSMLERTGTCPATGKMRFHYLTKMAPQVTKLTPVTLQIAKPYKYRFSGVMSYCPKCLTERGMKQHVWGKVVANSGVAAVGKSTKHYKCGSKLQRMTTSGAKFLWEAIKEDVKAENSTTFCQFVKDAIQKGK